MRLNRQLAIWVTGLITTMLVQPGWAEEGSRELRREEVKAHPPLPSSPVSRLRDLNRPTTTVKQWVAQIEAQTIQITNIKLDRTETGLDIILETAEGKPLQVDATKFRREGNNLVAEIPNAALALPQGQTFTADNPMADIATVQVTQQEGGGIRVRVAGKEALPKTEVTLKTGGLAYSLNAEADEPDEEIVVTGEREGYRVPNASTATRTDTPIRDVPASIQVVPRQVIEDQKAIQISEAVRNVSGVVQRSTAANRNDDISIRGFNFSNQFKDGFREGLGNRIFNETSNLERIEVLKGPASILYGQAEPGGIINLVTKKPLADPYYAAEFTAGSFSFYRSTLDLSGPLDSKQQVKYRLNVAYENAGSFRDFGQSERIFIAPTLTWDISPKTTLTLQGEYLNDQRTYDTGLIAIGNRVADLPISRFLAVPPSLAEYYQWRGSLSLDHNFNENLLLRSTFRYTSGDEVNPRGGNASQPGRLRPDNRTVPIDVFAGNQFVETYSWQNNLIGKFKTGSIQHTALLGIDFYKERYQSVYECATAGTLDIFNPVYEFSISPFEACEDFERTSNNVGVYIQDQITLAENLKLLVGGRLDFVDAKSTDNFSARTTEQSDNAFTPRVGIVYQPIEPVSLYASFSQSFVPQFGRSADDSPFKPEQGTQYEVGIKVELLKDRLFSTLAFYQITKTNVLTEDPDNRFFSIQVGEQQSRGIELDVTGEILPGWNIIASYAYNDARITKDNTYPVNNLLPNVPKHSFSLWTKYQIQTGTFRGLGFGAGVFFVGDRQGDLDNSLLLSGYTRTDAAIYYERGNFKAALNLKNLFDTEYFNSIRRTSVEPGAPFTVLGTISWKF